MIPDDTYTEARLTLSAADAGETDARLASLHADLVAPAGGTPWVWIEQPAPAPSPRAIVSPALCFWVPTRNDTAAWRDAVAEAVAAWSEAPDLRFTVGLRPPDADAWRHAHRPFRVGRVAIVPTGDRHPSRRPDDIALHLQPGGAFGTGRHATTRACLRALQRRLAPGQRVLDAGCGSGILAVAAARLGAGAVLGIDIEEVSVEVARDLALSHDVADRCTFRHEALGDHALPEAPFDGVLANIEDDVIRAQAPHLAALLAPGGWFVVSGCRSERRDELVATLAASGLIADRVDASFRWATCAGRLAPDGV